jgi:non-homologous end joining protein Ku
MEKENTLLLLQENHIEWGATKADEMLDFKEIIKNVFVGTAAEALDYRVFKMVLAAINTKVSPFIPDEYKDEVWLALDDVIDGDSDYKDAITEAIEVLSQLKDKLTLPEWVNKLLDTLLDLMKASLEFLLKQKTEEE